MMDDLLEQASRWHLRISRPTADLDLFSQFETWRLADPSHDLAYNRVVKGLRTFDAHVHAPEMAAVISNARDVANQRQPMRRKIRQRWFVSAAAFLLVAVISALIVEMLPDTAEGHVIATNVGERRTVVLDDGSTVLLDASTSIVAHYSRNRRDVALLSGQARFQVAHDTKRAFMVKLANETISGGENDFNIDRSNRRFIVTVIKGRLVLNSGTVSVWQRFWEGKNAATELTLGPNDQLTVLPTGAASLHRNTDLAATLSWQSGILHFNDIPVIDAVTMMNRYSTPPIHVVDERLAIKRIGGVFDTRSPKTLLEAISTIFPIETSVEADGSLDLRLRDDDHGAAKIQAPAHSGVHRYSGAAGQRPRSP